MEIGRDRLGVDAPLGPRGQSRPARLRWIALAVVLFGIVVFGCIALALRLATEEPRIPRRIAHPELLTPRQLTAADPANLEAVSPAQAEALNARLPVSTLPIKPAKPLAVPPDHLNDWARSIDCLTQAIYYEAGSEPLDGQRAVAQVILNRVRHPAFPHSVCGVIYQGSAQRTGCQFTFTCDGSLDRRPGGTWATARQIAVAAVSGYVFPSVGTSTFYHADYVLPYWAPSLVKVATIGRHIFYRWAGRQGDPVGFSAHYVGGEPGPAAAVPSGLGLQSGTLSSDGAERMPSERPILGRAGVPLSVDQAARPVVVQTTPAVASGSRYILFPGATTGAAEANASAAAD